MKNHKEPYGAIRNQKESYGPLIWVNRTNERTNERTDERTDSLLELAGFYPAAKNYVLNFIMKRSTTKQMGKKRLDE